MSVTLNTVSIENLALPKGSPGDKGASITVGASVLYSYTTDTGTAANTTETDLATYTNIPGTTNALTADGDEMVAKGVLTFAANGNTKNVRIKFGGTTAFTLTSTASGTVVFVEARIVRTSATAQKIYFTTTVTGVVTTVGKTTSAINLVANQIVKITGENGTATANDIVLNNFTVYSFKSV